MQAYHWLVHTQYNNPHNSIRIQYLATLQSQHSTSLYSSHKRLTLLSLFSGKSFYDP